jgi:hypothetical protein
MTAALLTACAGDDSPPVLQAPVLVRGATGAAALAADPTGGFWYGVRLTGAIHRVDAGGERSRPEVTVAVGGTVDDQRGLLGLAATPDGRLFAAWTRAGDGRLVVGQVLPGPERIVWAGPVAADMAIGGHLVAAPDGGLVIGVGDLMADPALGDDPTAPNRKLLRLDPDGGPDQRPTVLSSGWNNPFAFVYDAAGDLWVADNSPGEAPERLGRGDRPAREARPLPGEAIAPSGLVDLGDGRLGICGYLSGDLRAVVIGDGDEPVDPEPIAEPCRLGATRLLDGRVVLATDDDLHVTAELGGPAS